MRHSIPNIAERFFEWKSDNHDTIRGLCGPMRSWYRKKRWMAPSRHRPYHLTDEWWTNQIQCERGIKCASCWVRNMDDSHTPPWLQGTEYLGSLLETTCATALLFLETWKLWQLFCCLVVPRFIPHSQNLWRSKFIHHGQMWQILLFFPCPWIMKRKNPPLRLPYDWGRIGLQPFLCANARFKSKRWILMAIFRQSPNGHTQIFHQQEVQGAVQSMNCNSLTRVWATPL